MNSPISKLRQNEKVAFQRDELSLLMGLYGRMVASGEWRDYAMAFLKDVAVFSIYRRTAETPLYRVEKRPKERGKNAMYVVISMEGRILKRGNELRQVLSVLERKAIKAVQ